MYLMVSNVPFRPVAPGLAEVASDWARSLLLLRDSFEGRFGEITVAAPGLPPGEGLVGEQEPYRLGREHDGIRFVRLGEQGWEAREFWLHGPRIYAACERLARRADVVHAGLNNLWQPYSFLGFNAGLRVRATTVFVQDGDAIGRLYDLCRGASWPHHVRTRMYCRLYEQLARRAVARADLSLLKGHAVQARYRRFARNARDFHDTSYGIGDIISAVDLERKCAGLLGGEPLRCLSLGRLVDYKRVDHSIRAVSAAARAGVPIQLDVIGDGPAGAGLRRLTDELAAHNAVRFLGSRAYGSELLRAIAQYHVLLFTSLADETPRALFDGLAAGCALLGYRLPFTRQVIDAFRHGEAVPRGDVDALTATLCRLHLKRSGLCSWIRAAANCAADNTAEAWYRRRAEWTHVAHAARLRGTKRPYDRKCGHAVYRDDWRPELELLAPERSILPVSAQSRCDEQVQLCAGMDDELRGSLS